MKAHVIENNKVINTILVDSLDFLPNLVSAENGGSIGDQYVDGVFTPLPRPFEEVADRVRIKRDWLLKESDIKVLPDRWVGMTPEIQTEWSTYRQALRDVPSQQGFPWTVTWPTPPSS